MCLHGYLLTTFTLRGGIHDDFELYVAHTCNSSARNLRLEGGELKASWGCSGETCCRQEYQHTGRLAGSPGLDNLHRRTYAWVVGDETGSTDTNGWKHTPYTEGSGT